jgi:2-polyprenyl-3-methyl-5-hydroxy-6-metoxy-1,4-benzoquinol methylase
MPSAPADELIGTAVSSPCAVDETPDVETSSDDYASRFRGAAGRYLLSMQAWSVARALAGVPPGSALDVGGAHGQLLEVLRALGWQVTVHGTTSECETNLRKRHELERPFLQGPLHPLPVADGSFDLVISVRLLPHVSQWSRLIGEMCRASRGSVIVDYPSKGGLNALTPLLFGLKKSLEGNTRTYRSFSRAELARELASRGFQIERQVKQFSLPMVLHRVGRGAAPLRAVEGIARFTGLTALIGSPVVLRADRRGLSGGKQ